MPLTHQIVAAPASTPHRLLLFLHGILGSGANWRTFAKQILQERPSWGAVLVDLRLHGESRHGFSAPHTLAAAGRDVQDLIAALGLPVRGIFGHSFGGKVALEVARQRHCDLDHLFVIDSTPSARPDAKGSESTQHIVDLLKDLPSEFAERTAFTEWIEQRGVSRPTAMWLAMNVRQATSASAFTFRVDLAGIRELLADYFLRDLWSVLEEPPEGSDMKSHLIVGGKSGVVDEADRRRAANIQGTTLDVIAEADHWVHVDAPDALRSCVLGYLS